MRSFIIALSILSITTSFTVFSSFYISKSCDELISSAKHFPYDTYTFSDTEKISSVSREFSLQWEKTKEVLEFFVSLDMIENIDEAKNELSSRFYSEDFSGYLSARQKLISSLEELKKTK